MELSFDQKIHFTFKNDYLFKWALQSEDEETQAVRNKILSLITGLDVIHSTVRNIELLPSNGDFKDMYLDILVETQNGTRIDMEMQSSSFGEDARNKAAGYLARLYSEQIKGTEPYRFKAAHQIIFVDVKSPSGHQLISHMKIQDENGDYLTDKMQSHIVYLPDINELLKSKSLEELSLVEAIVYLFENGKTDDTIELSRKYQEVAVLMDKEEKFNADERLRNQAESRERFRQMQAAHINDARNEGLAQGLAQGISVGEDRLSKLITKLIAENELTLIEKVAQDKNFRDQLYKDYHIE
ncbi:MAG: PD-(D/E)XK nuclease family transposase [Erysipelotrichaceae bacterium]|nr:PD-(D/E)XK nuclease family transposase [Erysipelotrichaceae bacterium]